MSGDALATESRVRAELARHAATRALAVGRLEVVSGGLSNHAWCCEAGGRRYFVRLGSALAPSLGVDRAAEALLLEAVADAGLAPPVVLVDPVGDVLVTEWVEGEPWDCDSVRRPGDLERLGAALRTLHGLVPGSGWKQVSFAQQARRLEAGLAEYGIEDGALRARAEEALAELETRTPRLAACHHDLHHLNILDDGRRIWLVDWEYGGAGDPVFDFASFACQHELDRGLRETFLRAAGLGDGEGKSSLDAACVVFDYVQWLWYQSCIARREGSATGHAARAGAIRSRILRMR